MTLTIDDTLFARFREVAEANGQDPDRFAASVLADAIRHYEDVEISGVLTEAEAAREDETLTDADRDAIRTGIRRGLEDEAAGRVRPFAQFATEQRSKFNLLPSSF